MWTGGLGVEPEDMWNCMQCSTATLASLHCHLMGGIGYSFVGRISRAMSEFFDIVGSMGSLNPVKLIITHRKS
jgi:hypothetical protein